MDRRFRRVKYKFRNKNYPVKCKEDLEVDVLVAIANYVDDLMLIMRGKGFLPAINGNEAETDLTSLEGEGKDN